MPPSKDGLERSHSLLFSSRMAIAVVGFFGFVNLYAMRVNMSIAMVCMVNHTAVALQNTEESSNQTVKKVYCLNENETSTSKRISMGGEFDWSKPIQGQILASFFWGYLVTQLPGGWLGHRFGGKRVLGWCMFACAVSTLLVPVAARMHYGFLIALRIIAGLAQGVVWPATHCIWTKWAPPLERSRLIGFTFAGSQIGNVLTFPLAGLLCEYGFDGGWPSIFYIIGSCGIVWFIAWMVTVFDSPDLHPRVSESERMYIQKSLSGQVGLQQPKDIPWLEFVKSLPVWGIVVTHTCALWGVYTFLTNMPTYMKEVLNFDVKANGFLSAIPYIGFWAMINISGWLADTLRSRKLLSTTWCRKLFNTIGQVGPAIFVIILSHVDCTQRILGVVLLVVGVSLIGCLYGSGFVVNHADIAPKYSGILFGISNTIGTIPGFVAPIVIGLITKNQTRSEWQSVFYLTAGIFTFGAIFYLFTGSGDVQPWAKDDESIVIPEMAQMEIVDTDL